MATSTGPCQALRQLRTACHLLQFHASPSSWSPRRSHIPLPKCLSICFSVLLICGTEAPFRWFKRRCSSHSIFCVVSTSVTFTRLGDTHQRCCNKTQNKSRSSHNALCITHTSCLGLALKPHQSRPDDSDQIRHSCEGIIRKRQTDN